MTLWEETQELQIIAGEQIKKVFELRADKVNIKLLSKSTS